MWLRAFISVLCMCTLLRGGEIKKIPLKIGKVKIDKERPIDQSTYISFKLALDSFREAKIDALVIELDTPGGEVFSTLKMIDEIKSLSKEGIRVYCYINDWAISAGSLIAYACPHIYAAPTAIMGAAEPVHPGAGGEMISASQKVNSALSAQIASLAAMHNRSDVLAKAMVDKEMTVVRRKGHMTQLLSDQDIQEGDEVISPFGKLLTLGPKEIQKYGVSEMEASHIDQIEQAIVDAFDAEGEALWLTYSNPRLSVLAILLHPAVSGILFMLLSLGVYLELTTPGFGIPGGLAVLSGLLLIMANYGLHLISWMEIAFVLLGFVLLALEMFVIPGFGLIGLLGIVSLLVGGIALMVPAIRSVDLIRPELPLFAYREFFYLFQWATLAIAALLLLLFPFRNRIAGVIFQRNPLVLRDTEPGVEMSEGETILVGEKLMAATSLKPWGKAKIRDTIMDVFSESGYVRQGSDIFISRVEKQKIYVKKCH